MVIEVVLRDVGQRGDAKSAAREAVLFEGDGRRLHDHVARPGLPHLGQVLVQLQRPGCGQRSLLDLAAEPVSDGADDAGRVPGRSQDGLPGNWGGIMPVRSGYMPVKKALRPEVQLCMAR